MSTQTNDQKLDELERLLRELTDLQQQLVEAAEAKKDAMKRLDPQHIEQATALEHELIDRVQRVEAARRRVVSELSGNQPVGPGAMEALGRRVDEPRRGRLTRLRQQVVERARVLERLNAINRFVSRHCLEHFQGLLQALTVGGRTAPVYTARGAVRPVGGGCLVDRTA